MKIGRRKTKEGVSYFFVLPGSKLIDWHDVEISKIPKVVRSAFARVMNEGTNNALFDNLPVIEEFVNASPEYVLAPVGSGFPFDASTVLEPPVIPQNFICVGLNYRDHAAESGQQLPIRPLLFAKTSNALNGHNGIVHLTRDSKQLDYEAELVVIIGRRCCNVSAKEAFAYVAGYTCGNDVSARDMQFEAGQWYRGKSVDGFGPIGPWMVTKQEVPDPHTLRIQLKLNGMVMQESNTANLIFRIPELIAYISRTITLLPGDVIMTGTPPGVGFTRKPPIFLNAGDRMEVEISGVGTLINYIDI